MSYDPFRNYDAWLTTNPYEIGAWEEDYCANPGCKKRYEPEVLVALESGSGAEPPWPFCSTECAGAEDDRAAEAAEAQAEAAAEMLQFD